MAATLEVMDIVSEESKGQKQALLEVSTSRFFSKISNTRRIFHYFFFCSINFSTSSFQKESVEITATLGVLDVASEEKRSWNVLEVVTPNFFYCGLERSS